MKSADGSFFPIGSAAGLAWGQLLALVGLLTAVTLSAPCAFGQNTAEPVTVDSVSIVGLHAFTQDQVTSRLRTRPGQPFNQANIQEDIRALGDMKLFRPGSIKTDTKMVEGKNSVAIYFIVEEYPNVVQEVKYKNAHHMHDDELDAITGLKRGLPLNPQQNRRACDLIVEDYRKEGRYFASCVLEKGDQPNDTSVIFNIDEGPVVRVGTVTFTGNDTLASTARLRTQIDTSQMYFNLAFLASHFIPQKIDEDAHKLEDYYHENGYLDARVTREMIFSEDHSRVDIVFHIVEGLRYHVQDVKVKGTAVLAPELVTSVLKLHQGDTYDDKVVQADVRNITDLYGYRGYPANVNKQVVYLDRNTDPGQVRVEYDITERKPFKVGEPYIYGNDVTKNHVILRYLLQAGIFPGQTISYPSLKVAEALLARANFFDNSPENRPTVEVIERPDAPADSPFKDIGVHVKETMTGSLMFGASVNTDNGLVGSIVLNERNFDLFRPPTSWDDVWEGRAWRGGGQEFRLEAVPGTEVQRYSASWKEPYLFDLPYSLQVSAYYYQRLNEEDEESRLGFSVGVGHQLNRNWSITAGVRVEEVNVSNVPSYAPVDYTSQVGDHFIVAPRVTVARDDRDSVLRATEGGLASVTVEEILGAFSSPQVTFAGSRYFTVAQRADGSGKQVIALRTQASWTDDNTPVYERFFAGGINSLRGFEFRGVGVFENGFNNGGDFLFLNSIEYQLPVMADDKMYLVAFVDSGTVEQNVSIRDYRVSAGFGIRINIPMMGPVPLALDFGFPIVRGPGDREQVFQFYFGISK